MIPGSALAKLAALGLSTALVIGTALLVRFDDSPRIAGGGAPVAAQVGTTFADMAAGRLTPQPAQEISASPTPEARTLTASPRARTATRGLSPRADAPPVSATPRANAPEALQASRPAQSATAPAPKASAAQPVAPPQAARPTPKVLSPAAPPPHAPAPRRTATTRAAEPAPRDTIAAEPSDSEAPRLSRRPQLRDPALAPKPSKKVETPKRKARPKPAAQPAPRGNAARDNRQGAQSGGGTAKRSGPQMKPTAPSGNAAASNYPGEVMRRIARAGKPRVGARGTAVIGFTVASNGGLAQIGVARSSGSAALDRAAVALITKAAPFPRPPAGAQRRFSITIKGR